jgi:hypothetical protein
MIHRNEFERQAVYRIRLLGLLDPKWSDWFDGMSISHLAEETLLVGPVVDQSALHGLLAKICELGLPLISVQRMEMEKDEFQEQDLNA